MVVIRVATVPIIGFKLTGGRAVHPPARREFRLRLRILITPAVILQVLESHNFLSIMTPWSCIIDSRGCGGKFGFVHVGARLESCVANHSEGESTSHRREPMKYVHWRRVRS